MRRLLAVTAVPLCVVALLLAAVSAISATGGLADSCAGQPGGPPSREADASVPAELMPLFAAAEHAFGVPWNVLAAINKVETDFGRNLHTSSAGAMGWMQFMPATWARYGMDADGDGRAHPDNPADAIFSAASYLRASGAREHLRRALFAYNHADWYVELVLDWARRYAALPAGARAAACTPDVTGLSGVVEIAPGANLPGRSRPRRSHSSLAWPHCTAVHSSSPPEPTTPTTPSTVASPITLAGTPPTSAWPPTAATTTHRSAIA
jgi:hypothetical protein